MYLNMKIHQIITLIKSGKFEYSINSLRSVYTKNSREYQNTKTQLLSFSPAASFDGNRSFNSIKSLSGLLVLDFDHLEDLEFIRTKIIKEQSTLSCFISPSGQGLKVLVKTDASSTNGFKEAYGLATEFFQNLTGQQIDWADDLTRLCFLSSDSILYWNPTSISIEEKHKLF